MYSVVKTMLQYANTEADCGSAPHGTIRRHHSMEVQGRKKKKSPVKVVVPLILAVAAAGVGYKVVNRYIPSKEVMDGNEYFGTSGG